MVSAFGPLLLAFRIRITLLNTDRTKTDLHFFGKRSDQFSKYCKVASCRPVYYSKVQGPRPKVTVHKDQISSFIKNKKTLGRATNQDVLLLATLR